MEATPFYFEQQCNFLYLKSQDQNKGIFHETTNYFI